MGAPTSLKITASPLNIMNKTHIAAIIRELNRIAKGGKPAWPRMGLCGTVRKVHGWNMAIIPNYYRILVSWPHYSGSPSYPVPSVTPEYGAAIQYYKCNENGKHYKGKIGKLRRSLARFLAKEFQKQIEAKKPRKKSQ